MNADATAENRPAYSPEKQVNTSIEVDAGKNTHEDQRGLQVFIVFLHKVTVVLVSLALKLIVELDTGASSRSRGGSWQERWQYFK